MPNWNLFTLLKCEKVHPHLGKHEEFHTWQSTQDKWTNVHAKTANVHNRQKGNQKCINWQVNTNRICSTYTINRRKCAFYAVDGLQNIRWNHKTPEYYILCDSTYKKCPGKTNLQMHKAGQWLPGSAGEGGLEWASTTNNSRETFLAWGLCTSTNLLNILELQTFNGWVL